MIIGNGMIASAFHSLYDTSDEVLIFASGVSDSTCTNIHQFIRESELLRDSLEKNHNKRFFIYFSTCSIYDSSLVSQPYVMHKIAMEELSLSHPGGYVVRLPQVAGPQAPVNTLIASLIRKILANEDVIIWSNARRNVIDVQDVVRIVSFFIENKEFPKNIINVANPISYSVDEIVGVMEDLLKTNAIKKYISKGCSYDIDVTEINKITTLIDLNFGCDYLKNVILRYYT